jgi:N-acetylglucosaminyldiphosphoundecaprenol N-acetyl-beta-D-mannosaminyltransferase
MKYVHALNTRFFARVLGIDVDPVDMDGAVAHVAEALEEQRKGYVCVAGVHGIMEAQRDSRLPRIYAESEMTIPDGMPLVWVGRLQGHANMQRVTGPDLMLEIFRRPEFALRTHFLCGGATGVADELRDRLLERFPHLRIVGTHTPPFHTLSVTEEDELIDAVARCKPDIIWVGISTPKQELFMARYLPLLDTKLMFGVGAAFDYHTGRIRDCADWIKRAGLQWLHRLIQDPKRLLRRYLRNNPAFVLKIALQLSGVRPTSRTRHAALSDVSAYRLDASS